MMELVTVAAVVLAGAGIGIFVVLIAINLGLFVKLRSSIPQGPSQTPII